METEIEVPSQPATKTLCITVHTSKKHEKYGRKILFLIVGNFISIEKLIHIHCDSSLVSYANNQNAKKFTSKLPIGRGPG